MNALCNPVLDARRRAGLAAALVAAGAMVMLASLGTPRPSLAQASTCTASLSRLVNPTTVTLGQSVTVSLGFRADCPDVNQTVHVVFALDVSGSMAGQPLTDTVTAVKGWIDAMDLKRHLTSRVGLVAYNDTLVRRCALSRDEAQLDACLAGLPTKGGSDLSIGFVAALDILADGRQLVGPGDTPNEVIVVLSDGGNNLGCDPAKSAARRAKGQGVLVMTVCVGAACDVQCMRESASSARYYFTLDNAAAVGAILQTIMNANGGLRSLTITDQLPADMLPVDGAMGGGRWDPATRRLTWSLQSFQARAITFTYQIRPLEVGVHPTSLGAAAEFRDGSGAAGRVEALLASVTVLPDGGAPGPSLLANLEVEPGPLTVGQRAAVTLTLDLDLPEPAGETHLVVVADRSASMAGTFMTTAQEGTRAMFERLATEATGDFQAAVVRFNLFAERLCEFTPDVVLLRACVDAIPPADGATSVAMGLIEGGQTFADGPPWQGQKDMVVFSDGVNNTGCDPVLKAARDIKVTGVVLHSICLGGGCDVACMRMAASSPRHFFQLESPSQLPAALEIITEDLLARRGVEVVELDLRLPSHLRFIVDSASHWPYQEDASGARWNLYRLPHGGLQLTFQVEAVAAGSGAIQLSVNLPMLNAAPLSRQLQAPVDVLTSPPTIDAPSPTVETVPTLTPTYSSPTQQPGTTRIYLPLALSEACAGPRVDLVLVIDSSLSMGERLGAEGSKLEAARAAVNELLGQLDLSRHRVTLVATDATARRLSPFGQDAAAVRAALAQLELGNGTALDKGLTLAADLLLGAERRANTRGVILLLSDGRAHEAAPADAIAAAQRARDLKLEVYTVGLGQEVDARTLIAIADSPERFQAAPDRAAALRAFGRLAGWMDCPAEGLWGTR